MEYQEKLRRAVLIDSMNEIVKHMNHEVAYEIWLMDYPEDCETREQYEMAEDETYFNELVNTFNSILKTYGKYGVGV